MAVLTAKFSGQCRACGGAFPAGTQIEWTKGAGSTHVKCPEKATPEGKPTLTITLDWRGYGKPPVDSEVGKTLRVTERGPHQGQVVTVLTQRRSYQSAEDNEDMGDMRGGGWWVTLGCRPATPEETAKLEAEEAHERAAEETRRQKVAEEKAAREAEISAAKAKLAELTAGMEKTESFDSTVLSPQGSVVVATWSEGDRHSVVVYQRTAVTGETVYVVQSHDFDDDRSTLYAPRQVIEVSWTALAARYGETPEKAREWLAKYSRCVGADWRRWLVERAEET